MKAAALACLALLLPLAACGPKHELGSEVRRSLDAQAATAGNDDFLTQQTEKARAALGRWPGKSGIELDLALGEASRELTLATATGDPNDLRLMLSLEAFRNASEILAGSQKPLQGADLGAVAELLQTCRAEALAARSHVPTSVSPTNALKTLRKYQSSPSHYDY